VSIGRKIRVLVADDESRVRNVISRAVTALGAEVVGEAGDGRHALAPSRRCARRW
jgi:YesN/AraC family two-component response regulator